MRASTPNPVDGVEIAWEAAGEGPPLLLVHGSGLSRGTWRGLGYLRDLQRDFTVVALDLRGHGRSGAPHDVAAYDTGRHLGDVTAVLDAAAASGAIEGPAHYVGYSFGARIGLALAAAEPDRLRTLTAIGGDWAPMDGDIARTFTPRWREALGTGDMGAFLAAWEESAGGPLDPGTRLAFAQDDALALLAYFEAAEQSPGVPLAVLAGVRTPTLLMAGTRDERRARHSQQAAKVMPDARFSWLEGQDHGSSLLPVDEVTDLLRTFLEAVDA